MRSLAAAAGVLVLGAAFEAKSFVYELEREFLTTGDFDGDGKVDVAIVDRPTGRVRLGYSLGGGVFDWVEWRASGLKDASSVSVGKLREGRGDSIAFTSVDMNLVTVLAARSRTVPEDPTSIAVSTLGPNQAIAIDIGGNGNTPLHDLFVPSVYNSDPSPNRVTLYRNDGKSFTQISETPTPFVGSHGNRIALKNGGKEFAAAICAEGETEKLMVGTLENGKPETVLTVDGFAKGSDYVTGDFRGKGLRDFVFYRSGEPEITVRTVDEAGGKFQAGTTAKFTLPKPVRQLVTVEGSGRSRLLAVFGDTEPAQLMNFDAASAPSVVQELAGMTNKFLNGAIALPDSLVLLSVLTNDRPRSVAHYQVYALKDGAFKPSVYGTLPNLDDRDEITVETIHKAIVSSLKEKTAADMKSYTNVMPGTEVKYSMVALPGGEFTMGTPENEKDRKPDEGPQHRVKVSPFWIGQFEVTWDMYLLFMYKDDEENLRKRFPTTAELNELTDAVTRPSKPYVDMSFGMGKKDYPAIAMTQHGANKFCHWLSAKTGHFYRLPTEAEWEYACRAGTTNAYSFGDDSSKLGDYAWFFDNSNSQYQKVGKKLPNPWGLYDMHGNVTEWVLDQYAEDTYASRAGATTTDPWVKATMPYPHSVRGGSWDDDYFALRSGTRRGSSRDWKMTDPQLPKGKWYLTDAKFIGFRLVRPLTVPPPETMVKYWISGVEKE